MMTDWARRRKRCGAVRIGQVQDELDPVLGRRELVAVGRGRSGRSPRRSGPGRISPFLMSANFMGVLLVVDLQAVMMSRPVMSA